MLISCPSCATQFSVPDQALGAKGRTLKCARCGDKWFQPGSGEPEPPQPAPPAPMPEVRRDPEPQPEPDQPPMLPGFEDFTFDSSDFAPLGRAAQRDDDDDDVEKEDLTEDRSAMFLDEDDRIPTALSPRAPRRTPEPGRRRRGGGTVVLWTVAISLVVIGLLGGTVYLLQNEIARLFPFADQALQAVGLREEQVGDGLQIRNQRVELVAEGHREVLVIRGVIANVTDRPRDVPWVRAALLDDKNVVVMDRLVRPPVDGLDAGATTVFTVRIESPHPDARSINLFFALPPVPNG